MAFNTLSFWIIFLPLLILYQLSSQKLKNVILLVSSYFFYSLFDWRFCFIILLSTVTDFVSGYCSYHAKKRWKQNFFLLLSLTVNLGLLITFKYFYVDISDWGLKALLQGDSPGRYLAALTFPVGISFYTFQTLSYTIDCYKKKLIPTTSFISFAVYVSYFPQLLAGPIERASKLLKQIEAPKTITPQQVQTGFFLVLLGLAKKNFYSAYFWTEISNIDKMASSTPQSILMGLFMIMYVYCDFSGYCDIGRGISNFFGINLSLNFKAFYYAKNPTQLWARWNLTLTFWVRDYVLIPLARLIRHDLWVNFSILVAMSLIGIWHGFTLAWFSFGLFQGLVIVFLRNIKKPLSVIISEKKSDNFVQLVTLLSLIVMGSIHLSIIKNNNIFSYPFVWSDISHLLLLFKTLSLALIIYLPLLIFEYFQEKTNNYEFIFNQTNAIKIIFSAICIMLVLWGQFYTETSFVYFGF